MADKVVVVSGYFNPIHIGHVRYIQEAKKLGTKLIVVVNTDHQVSLKGSVPFMNENDRLEIVKALRDVDEAILAIDKGRSTAETLRMLKPHIVANGGDRDEKDSQDINSPLYKDMEVCKELGIEMIFGVGGGKIQSSSSLIKNVR